MYNSVGWCAPTLQQIEMALTHSLCTFAVYENEQLVGMAKLLGDSAMSFYIKDFAVRPDWQSKGVCRFLVENLEQYIMNQLPDKWAVSLELVLRARNVSMKNSVSSSAHAIGTAPVCLK